MLCGCDMRKFTYTTILCEPQYLSNTVVLKSLVPNYKECYCKEGQFALDDTNALENMQGGYYLSAHSNRLNVGHVFCP